MSDDDKYLREYPQIVLANALEAGDVDRARRALSQYLLRGSQPILRWHELKKLVDTNNRPLLRLIVLWLEPWAPMDIVLREPKDHARYIKCLRNAGMKIPALTAEEKNLITVRPGDRMKDGSIYLAFYQGQDWYVTAGGDKLKRNFNEASQFVKGLTTHGRNDWMLPGETILGIMVDHKDAGDFAGTYYTRQENEYIRHGYWSSTTPEASGYEGLRSIWSFDGGRSCSWENGHHLVRAVRSEPRKLKKGFN